MWQFLKDLETEIPHDPAIPLLGLSQRVINYSLIKTHAHHMFIEVLFTIAKPWTQPRCPSRIDWIKKMWHIYTMEYYAASKKMSSCPVQGHR